MTAHEEARATTSLVVYEPPAVLNVQQAERRYELPRTGAVFVRQAWGSGDTGAAQWPAGVELAKLIDSEGPERWRGKRVLEISAGGGAVVAIALMRAGAVVVATDVTTTYRQRSPANTARMQEHLRALIEAAPGHVAVFAPSYALLEEIAGRQLADVDA